MSEPLEHEYFKWLYSQVSDVLTTDPYLTYDYLFGRLHRTRFVPLVSGDDNRAQDGKDLRLDFFNEIGYRDEPFLKEDASVFEVLIAFSRRASFETHRCAQASTWCTHSPHSSNRAHPAFAGRAWSRERSSAHR